MPPINTKPLSILSWSIAATILLAALLVAATMLLVARTRAADESVRHTLAVRGQIAQVLTLVQRVETSQRGYLLTGRNIYLTPYNDAARVLPAVLDETSRLVDDNPQQQQAVARLKDVIADKLRELRTTVDEQKAGNADAALAIVNSDHGLQMMDEIRQLLSEMEREENRVLAVRQANSVVFSTLLQIGAATSFLLICAVGVLVSFFIRRSFADVTAGRDQLAITNQRLIEQMQQREQTEIQLRQMQKMKAIGDLTGGIAHDFNNMLGVITGSLDLIRRRIDRGDFGIERFLEAANAAARRAASLTHRLLAFARQQPLAPQALDANKMIAHMSDLLRSTLGEHIDIETVSAAGLWTTSADLNQLENAILNIAINARDAMQEGGRLTIETANAHIDEAYCQEHADVEPGQFVMIAITDTGVGMSPEVVARAFDPFFTTKPTGAGTGLGLSQVYGFIKQSRGHIKIYSEPGNGTSVKIYLPRFMGDLKEIAKSAPVSAQVGSPDDIVLLVEDDPLARRLATEALRELGYTVLDSDNAINALAILDKRSDVKLLFTDVVMPEMNGKKLVEEAVRRRSDLKVLFTTGYTRNAVVHGGVLDPDVQLLTKPFTLDQLATKVRAVLDA